MFLQKLQRKPTCSFKDSLRTRLSDADVQNGRLVFLREILRSGLEVKSAVIFFDHLENANSVSVRQPGDERSAVENTQRVS